MVGRQYRFSTIRLLCPLTAASSIKFGNFSFMKKDGQFIEACYLYVFDRHFQSACVYVCVDPRANTALCLMTHQPVNDCIRHASGAKGRSCGMPETVEDY